MTAGAPPRDPSMPPAAERSRAKVRQRWLVHHYCQGAGLASCLRLLCGEVEVEVIDQYSSEDHRAAVLDQIAGFDRIIVEPTIARKFGAADQPRLLVVPTLAFRGYHPDFFLLRRGDGRQFAGPTGSSQSMIAYAAFHAGLSERHAVALYREDVYAACGYLDQWSASREQLLSAFRHHGLELGREFVRWSRRGPFMHSIIHPRIGCLRDVALKLVERAGLPACPAEFLPPDELAYREVLPVYPEIARRVGIGGSYLFKRGDDQRIYSLEEYVERSYAGFRNARDAKVLGAYVPVLEKVRTAVEEFT